jgi:hypothetical protein
MTNLITYRKHTSIGNPDADDDDEYLRTCFVNNGDLTVLTDIDNPKSIILGRTGSGKTALIRHLSDTEKDRVITLDPNSLSLNYISNSTIISYFEELGVKLDVFYQYLWRHIFCVEIIRFHYKISNKESFDTFYQSISNVFGLDHTKKAAQDYLRQWADTFWLETEPRIKEFVNKFETKATADIGLSYVPVSFKGGSTETISSEQKGEFLRKGQKVVESVQMKSLSSVIELLNEELSSNYGHNYYIVIDKLDENWVDDKTRYRMIRALIEVIKTFRRISSVKIIIALRIDLLNRVFDHTRDSGFQEEKYESLFLKINWTREQLKLLVDRRISLLFRRQYTKENIDFSVLFPNKISSKFSFDYILSRTLMRPRDIISFINECLQKMEGKASITGIPGNIVRQAEALYSTKRLSALRDEWIVQHPLLQEYLSFRRKKSEEFKLTDIEDAEIDELSLTLATHDAADLDTLSPIAIRYVERKIDKRAFLISWVQALYKIGVIGVKPDTYLPFQWSYEAAPTISDGAITEASRFSVHPMVMRALGVSPQEALEDR